MYHLFVTSSFRGQRLAKLPLAQKLDENEGKCLMDSKRNSETSPKTGGFHAAYGDPPVRQVRILAFWD